MNIKMIKNAMTIDVSCEKFNQAVSRSARSGAYFVAKINPPRNPSAVNIFFKNPSRKPTTTNKSIPIRMQRSIEFNVILPKVF